MKKILLGIGLVLFVFLNILNVEATGMSSSEHSSIANNSINSNQEIEKYINYIDHYNQTNPVDEDVVLNIFSYDETNSQGVSLEDEYIVTSEESEFILDFNISKAGLYNIEITYKPFLGESINVERALYLDGTIPFYEAGILVLPRIWEDDPESAGNTRPKQVEKDRIISYTLEDNTKTINDPFKFYLSQGDHTLKIVGIRGGLKLKAIRLIKPEVVPTYDNYINSYKNQGATVINKTVKIQAENAYEKSSPSLVAQYDRTSNKTEFSGEKFSYKKLQYNTIGASSWSTQGDFITWQIDVPETGLYYISLRNRQSINRGLISTRELRINGKVPFAEAKSISFDYSSYWRKTSLGNEDGSFLFYLEKGVNEITLIVSLGNIGPIVANVEQMLGELNHLYREIITITGTTPDPYRDYNLSRYITNIEERLAELSHGLADTIKVLEKNGKSNENQILYKLKLQLDDFAKNAEVIPKRINDYKGNISALGIWVLNVKSQPLEIDYITIGGKNLKTVKDDMNFFQKIFHEIKLLFYSYFINFSELNSNDKDSLEVWIFTNRDEAQILRKIIDEDFSSRLNINVDLKLVDGNVLLPALVAGKGPDVAMGVSIEAPVNYALRGAVHDISQFSDFEDITTRFMPSAMLPFELNGGYYALPDQHVFPVMFYRTDILNELGLTAPDTWDDFKYVLSVLQKNNFEVFLQESSQSTYGAGRVAGSKRPNEIFSALLFQQGGDYYLENGKKTALLTEASKEAFIEWTSFYTNYNIPIDANFVNRFRTGEMPIGIANYNVYNTLSVFAPEIKGDWRFAPIPGTLGEDGVVHREISGTGTGIIILKDSDKKAQAWEYLKWWTEAETQVKFGRELEVLLGAAARYPSANIQAVSELPWSKDEYTTLLEQWEWVRGIKVVPGGYITGRYLENAFRDVVNNRVNPRETLYEHCILIDVELARKQKEFGMGD